VTWSPWRDRVAACGRWLTGSKARSRAWLITVNYKTCEAEHLVHRVPDQRFRRQPANRRSFIFNSAVCSFVVETTRQQAIQECYRVSLSILLSLKIKKLMNTKRQNNCFWLTIFLQYLCVLLPVFFSSSLACTLTLSWRALSTRTVFFVFHFLH